MPKGFLHRRIGISNSKEASGKIWEIYNNGNKIRKQIHLYNRCLFPQS